MVYVCGMYVCAYYVCAPYVCIAEASEGHPVSCYVSLHCISLGRSLAELGAHCFSARLTLARKPQGYPQPHSITRVPGMASHFWLFTWVLKIRTQAFMLE